jgi:peptidoglycan/LPS O-acetylase OafA/YrhL
MRILTHLFLLQTENSSILTQFIFYFTTIFQIEPFAIGGLIAIFAIYFQDKPGFIYLPIAAFISLGIIELLFSSFSPFTLGYPLLTSIGHTYLWRYSVINLCAGALILACLQDKWWMRWANNAFLVFIGKISYGMYVYHYILIYVFIHIIFTNYLATKSIPALIIVFIIYFIATTAIAYTSFQLFEKFFMRFKNRFDRKIPQKTLLSSNVFLFVKPDEKE